MIEANEENITASQKAREDYFSKKIKNLELLEYYAFKMNDIYYYKSYMSVSSDYEKKMLNIERWKLFRNICLLVLFLRLLFTKPDWCNQSSGEINQECSRNLNTNIHYFTVTRYYLNVYNFEITSWFLMLLLILYDLFRTQLNPYLVFTYCALFIFDIITGFLYMNEFIRIKVNHISIYIFLILYM